ncbi:MAG: right-handed parallel beta-helix repeat-containing protein [candidate division Zixibacteria bacterium]|nr:right-handed parallel beta-helix repeat-containing protein [candidate division Zixibacteria bacterium]
MRYSILVIVGVLCCVTAFGATIHVPGDQPTIQAGIDAAVNGDTVLVANGTYTGDGNRDIDFGGKGIVLRSENGPDFTIIDCNCSVIDCHRGFFFHSGEDSAAVVDGFTITDGCGCYGGYTEQSVGSGIRCDSSSSPTITNNTISGNSAIGGGGISCNDHSNPIISNNTIRGNSAFFGGGGISCNDHSNPTISSNTISGNSGFSGGGGISCNDHSSPTISNNTISGNSAKGGIGSPGHGGGISCDNSNPTISNNTITRNSAGDGGGISCHQSSPTITNSIIWANTGGQISGSPIVAYCDIAGGWEGEGNINTNPLFVDPYNDNYDVCSQSPCIDAGNPDMLDADGTGSDIGVFYPNHPECNFGNIWYVSPGGNDTTGDGSPSNPFRTIQHAINVSVHLDSVIVENGTYREKINFGGKSTLVASNYVFSGDTRDIQNTIIDGTSDSTFATFASLVTFISNEDSAAIITGFTIRDARLTGAISCYDSNPTISYNTISGNSAFSRGGGIGCRFSSPTISNNTISGNSSPSGGGLSCQYSSFPSLVNNIIAFSIDGEAIYCDGSSGPVLTCCNVYGNEGGDWLECIADQAEMNGNFSADPQFCDTASGDYHLNAVSPCLPANNECRGLIGALGVGCTCCRFRGDVNHDGKPVLDVADLLFLIYYVFREGPQPDCLEEANVFVDQAGVVDIVDLQYLIDYMFNEGPAPPPCP